LDLKQTPGSTSQHTQFKFNLPDAIPVVKGQILSIHHDGPPPLAFSTDKVSGFCEKLTFITGLNL